MSQVFDDSKKQRPGSEHDSAFVPASGVSCTVNVTFTPTAPGVRKGAVVFYSTERTPLASIPVYGIGLSPEAAFSPSTQTALGGGFSHPQGTAVDASGNVYVADNSNNAVKKIPAGCASSDCVATLGGGFLEPRGVAVDGAGNVYVADSIGVKEIPAGCASAACAINVAGGFNGPTGVAVDGRFNLYVADGGNNAVKMIPRTCRAAECVVTLGGGLNAPSSLALDSARNVYVADAGNSAVKKIPAGCDFAGCVVTLGGSFTEPEGVAVDAAGDVYVAALSFTSIQEIPKGCRAAGCVRSLGGGLSDPAGVAVDASGNLYVASSGNASVYSLNRAAPPVLSFDDTVGGQTSTDSPKTVTVENIGNQALSFTGVGFPGDFPEAPLTTLDYCSTGNPLVPGSTCTVGIDFSPPAGSIIGFHNGDVRLIDNAFKDFGGTQLIPVSGAVVPPSQ